MLADVLVCDLMVFGSIAALVDQPRISSRSMSYRQRKGGCGRERGGGEDFKGQECEP